jgi:recombination protein RecT
MTDSVQTQEAAQENPMKQLRCYLEGAMKAEIAKALPKDIDADRFIRTVITAVQMNNELIYADRRSLLASCMKAAQDGLMPDGREAVLNIYNTKVKVDGRDVWIQMVQYLPMVRGLLKVARNSGEIAHIDAAAVYEKDDFVFERGDDAKIVHRPYLGGEDPGQVIASYMIAKLTNGETHREVMSRRDIEKVREASKASNGPGWSKWYDQFAIKSVIKRGTKLLPQSSDRLNRVIEHDNEAMGFDFNQRGVEAQMIESKPQPKPALAEGRPSRVAAIVGANKKPETVQVSSAAQNENTDQAQGEVPDPAFIAGLESGESTGAGE